MGESWTYLGEARALGVEVRCRQDASNLTRCKPNGGASSTVNCKYGWMRVDRSRMHAIDKNIGVEHLEVNLRTYVPTYIHVPTCYPHNLLADDGRLSWRWNTEDGRFDQKDSPSIRRPTMGTNCRLRWPGSQGQRPTAGRRGWVGIPLWGSVSSPPTTNWGRLERPNNDRIHTIPVKSVIHPGCLPLG